MYNSTFSSMIDNAVQDCIDYGSGQASCKIGGAAFKAVAVWAENEQDIEVAVHEGCVLRITFTEPIPEECR